MIDQLAREERRLAMPLILAISDAPLLVEALAHDLAGTAVVCRFPAGREDPRGLVAQVAPDLVLVDRRHEAEALESFDLPLVHVLVERRSVRARREDGWHEFAIPDASTAAIRNVLLGELFAAAANRRLRATPRAEALTEARPGGN
jgi:hypothetical protein